jgi:hypothetical protein
LLRSDDYNNQRFVNYGTWAEAAMRRGDNIVHLKRINEALQRENMMVHGTDG